MEFSNEIRLKGFLGDTKFKKLLNLLLKQEKLNDCVLYGWCFDLQNYTGYLFCKIYCASLNLFIYLCFQINSYIHSLAESYISKGTDWFMKSISGLWSKLFTPSLYFLLIGKAWKLVRWIQCSFYAEFGWKQREYWRKVKLTRIIFHNTVNEKLGIIFSDHFL